MTICIAIIIIISTYCQMSIVLHVLSFMTFLSFNLLVLCCSFALLFVFTFVDLLNARNTISFHIYILSFVTKETFLFVALCIYICTYMYISILCVFVLG